MFFHPNQRITAVGGAEKRFIETSEFFAQQGLELVVLESTPSLLDHGNAHRQIYTLSSLFETSRGWFAIYANWMLWTALACVRSVLLTREFKCRLVLAPNNTMPNLLSAYFAHLMTRLPLCVVAHHMDVTSRDASRDFAGVLGSYRRVGYGLYVSFMKAVAFVTTAHMLRKANACITVSDFTAQTLRRLGVKPQRIHVSGNGVDTQRIDQIAAPPQKAYSAVFVGRISKEKGVFDLLKVWSRITPPVVLNRLLIVGSGPDIAKMKKEILTYGLDERVVLCGGVSDEKMFSLLKSSKVFVFPSRFEGWGLAVAEALACGVPVVCYDIPALREVFGKCKSVFFTPLGNLEAFSEATEKVLNLNEEEYAKLREESTSYVQQFSWKEVGMKDLRAIVKLASE